MTTSRVPQQSFLSPWEPLRAWSAIRASGSAEVPSQKVGLAILGPLRDLDEVACLRFASVYRSFSSIEDVEKEIRNLREVPSHQRQHIEEQAT